MTVVCAEATLSQFGQFHQIGPRGSRAPRQQRRSHGLKPFFYSKRSVLCQKLKHALFCFYPGEC